MKDSRSTSVSRPTPLPSQGPTRAARSSRPGLPENYEFFVGDGATVFDTYQRSLSAVAYFIDRYGFRRFQRFYVTLGQATRVPGTFRYQFDRALEETIGLGPARVRAGLGK